MWEILLAEIQQHQFPEGGFRHRWVLGVSRAYFLAFSLMNILSCKQLVVGQPLCLVYCSTCCSLSLVQVQVERPQSNGVVTDINRIHRGRKGERFLAEFHPQLSVLRVIFQSNTSLRGPSHICWTGMFVGLTYSTFSAERKNSKKPCGILFRCHMKSVCYHGHSFDSSLLFSHLNYSNQNDGLQSISFGQHRKSRASWHIRKLILNE